VPLKNDKVTYWHDYEPTPIKYFIKHYENWYTIRYKLYLRYFETKAIGNAYALEYPISDFFSINCYVLPLRIFECFVYSSALINMYQKNTYFLNKVLINKPNLNYLTQKKASKKPAFKLKIHITIEGGKLKRDTLFYKSIIHLRLHCIYINQVLKI
jgi:hypothetical protein